MQRGERKAVIVKMPTEMHAGLMAVSAESGESAGTIIRSLVREVIARGAPFGVTAVGNAVARPLGRLDK
jgi:hypothetical protein